MTRAKKKESISEETTLQKLIRIPLIFEIIAKCLSTKDLKSCRRVSLGWRDATTFDFIRVDSLKTKIISLPPLSPHQTIKNINHLLLHSHRFPSTGFHLRGPLDLVELQKFFFLVGPTIQSLTLVNTGHLNSKERISHLFQTQAPNIRALKLFENFNLNWTPQDKIVLPSLKKISIPCNYNEKDETIEKFLISASNLESLDNVTNAWFNCLVNLKMVHLVQTIKWIRLDNMATMKDLTIFANALPKIKKCGPCSLQWPPDEIGPSDEALKYFVDSFLKILTSSAITLKDLELTPLPYEKSNSLFPCLNNVKKLRLRNSYNSTWTCFPLTCNLTSSFPNLVTLNVHWFREWDQFFLFRDEGDKNGGILTVRNLECGDELPQEALRLLVNFCPNVKKLRIHAGSRLTTFMPLVCLQWPLLENLELLEVPPYYCVMWDNALTGFSEEVCQEELGPIVNRRTNNYFRFERQPWIGQLKKLKTFHIYLHGDNPVRKSAPLRLTHISGLYAFQVMPNLRVHISTFRGIKFSLAMQASLKSVAPFCHELIFN